jgi:hypothetical protein
VKKAFYFDSEDVELQEFGTSGCSWELENVNAKPEATVKGTLCVFTQPPGDEGALQFAFLQVPGEVFESGYGPSGSYLRLTKKVSPPETPPSGYFIYGTWAVTAP